MRKIEIEKNMVQYVKNKDKSKIITGLYGIVLSDRRIEDGVLEANLQYIKNNGIDIFENLNINNPLISKEKIEYTMNDFTEAAIYLSENFCIERIEDVKKIGRYVYRNSEANAKGNNHNKNIGEQKSQSVDKKKIIAVGIGVTAAIIAAIATIYAITK